MGTSRDTRRGGSTLRTKALEGAASIGWSGGADNIRCLETLETCVLPSDPAGRGEARARMTTHLGRLAQARRGDLGPEEEAEARSVTETVWWQIAEIRGEGGR